MNWQFGSFWTVHFAKLTKEFGSVHFCCFLHAWVNNDVIGDGLWPTL